jgi:hypothetical protein
VTKADSRDEILALAERVEQAAGPDPMLDRAILRHAVREAVWDVAPPYTASLDAAMMLVPEGRHVKLSFPVFENWAQVVDETRALGRASPATPALALVAAALRAHADQGE